MMHEPSAGFIETIKAWRELLGVLLGFGAAIVTYLLTERRKRLDQFRGIWIELRYNKKGVDTFLEGPGIEELLSVLRAKALKRPHWRFSPTTRFYEAHAGNLSLPPAVQDDAINVYNFLFTIRSDIESVNSDVFLEITDSGREIGLRRRYADLGRLSAEISRVLADMRRLQPWGVKLPRDGECS